MAATDFANNQNTMYGIVWRYIYAWNIKIRIKDNTWNVIIFTINCKILLQNLVGTVLHLSI